MNQDLVDRLTKAREYVKERRKKILEDPYKQVFDYAIMREKMGARWYNIMQTMEEQYEDIERFYSDDFRKNQEVLKKIEDEIYAENRERITKQWYDRAQAAPADVQNPRYGDFRRRNGELEMWSHNPIRLSNGSIKRGMWIKVKVEAPKAGKDYGRVITNVHRDFQLDPRNDPTLQSTTTTTSSTTRYNRNRNRTYNRRYNRNRTYNRRYNREYNRRYNRNRTYTNRGQGMGKGAGAEQRK